jgi:hypothetical protein
MDIPCIDCIDLRKIVRIMHPPLTHLCRRTKHARPYAHLVTTTIWGPQSSCGQFILFEPHSFLKWIMFEWLRRATYQAERRHEHVEHLKGAGGSIVCNTSDFFVGLYLPWFISWLELMLKSSHSRAIQHRYTCSACSFDWLVRVQESICHLSSVHRYMPLGWFCSFQRLTTVTWMSTGHWAGQLIYLTSEVLCVTVNWTSQPYVISST